MEGGRGMGASWDVEDQIQGPDYAVHVGRGLAWAYEHGFGFHDSSDFSTMAAEYRKSTGVAMMPSSRQAQRATTHSGRFSLQKTILSPLRDCGVAKVFGEALGGSGSFGVGVKGYIEVTQAEEESDDILNYDISARLPQEEPRGIPHQPDSWKVLPLFRNRGTRQGPRGEGF